MSLTKPQPSLKNLFLTAAADRERLPVVLLSGFLGAGKTTLVNTLLRDARLAHTAVAVNEFGAIPLDGDLIDHGVDKTVVMANGCLCCNLAGDMEEAVMRLFSRRADGEMPGFERLIIEPSGLADPAPIAQGILRNPMLARALRLEAIVTLVDALFGMAQIDRHPESCKQIALADTLVISKVDLVDADQLDRLKVMLRRLNPDAAIIVADQGAVPVEAVFPAAFIDPNVAGETVSPMQSRLYAEAVAEPDASHLARIASVSLSARQPLDWRAFEGWLRAIRLTRSEQLLRVKGLLDIAGVAGPVVIQGVHHVLHTPVERDGWPAPAKDAEIGHDRRRQSRLVMIVDGSIAAEIRASWDAALPGLVA